MDGTNTWSGAQTFSATTFTIGAGAAGIDYILKFDGESNDGTITYNEDEDLFYISTGSVYDGPIQTGGSETGQSSISSGLVVNSAGGGTDDDDFIAATDSNDVAFQVDASEDEVKIAVPTKIGDGGTSDYSEFEADGTLKFNGEATVWEDLRVPSQNTKINPTKSEPAFEEFTDGLYLYKFSTTNANDESVHFVAQMSHSYKEGSDIHPHLHWAPDNTDTGDVVWEFEYIIANIDGTFAATATTDTKTDAGDGTTLKHQLINFDTISGVGLTISHMIICRLTRLGTHGSDTFTGNACFLEFDFHYEQDTVGSRSIAEK